MENSRPSQSVFTFRTVEDKLTEYFPNNGLDSPTEQKEYSEAAIYEITDLLQHINKTWSRHPRLYIVLRVIGQLELLDSLIVQGVTDFWFPFIPASLPRVISPSVRNNILETQWMVLTKAVDLEKGENGEHRRFAKGEPLPFERKAFLGKGGFGQVDKVLSKLSHKEYARKLIPRGGRNFEERRQQMELFEKEVNILKLLKRVKHHHIVELIGSYTDPIYIGLIMSPVADCDMAKFFTLVSDSDDRKSLLRSYYGCLASALVYLHMAKIRHKDIKPQNILVKDDNVLLTDFGLSLDWQDLGGATTTGVTPKSPRYCAPEVADYEPRNESSDIWSLGCVFLEMATILKGHTDDTMKAYFECNGSKSYFYRSNRVAVTHWMENLRGYGSSLDNVAFEWIQAMLQHDRKLRPDAIMIAADIRDTNFSSSSLVFCGICCSIDEELTAIAGDDEEGPILDSGKPTFKLTHRARHFHDDTAVGNMKGVRDREKEASGKRGATTESSKASPELISPPRDQHFASPANLKSEHTSLSTSSALVNAIKGGDVRQADALIKSGANISMREKDGSTSLHWASKLNLPSIISLLLREEGLSIIQDKQGRTALSWAAESGHLICMEYLLRVEGDPDHKDLMGRTALSWAAEMGRSGIVAILLSCKGVNSNSRDSTGATPLAWAAATATPGQQETMISLLRDARINPNSTDVQGLTALACATIKGNIEALRLILDHKATDPNIRDDTGVPPLVHAVFIPDPDMMQLLLERGADPNVTAEFMEGKSPVRDSLLSYSAAVNLPVIAQLLLNYGVDPNQAFGENPAPLHWAAIMGSTEVVLMLLRSRHIYVDLRDHDGRTPLSWAAFKGHLDVVQLLLDRRVDVKKDSRDRNKRRTPLHWAAMKGHSHVVRELLIAGADASMVDAAGVTPSMLALQCRRREVVKVFDDFNVSP